MISTRNKNKIKIKFKNKKKRKSVLNRVPKSLSSATQGMGPGSTLARITNNYVFVPQDDIISSVFDFMHNVQDNVEFERFTTIFKYFKVIGVKIIFPPRIRNESDYDVLLNGRVTIDWANNLEENLQGDDGSKEFTAYSTRSKVYRFKPPNSILYNTNRDYSVNYTEWTPIEQIGILPGFLKLTTNFRAQFIVETVIAFRGNQTNRRDDDFIYYKKGKNKQEKVNTKDINTINIRDKKEEKDRLAKWYVDPEDEINEEEEIKQEESDEEGQKNGNNKEERKEENKKRGKEDKKEEDEKKEKKLKKILNKLKNVDQY